jgi:hypothetical protein
MSDTIVAQSQASECQKASKNLWAPKWQDFISKEKEFGDNDKGESKRKKGKAIAKITSVTLLNLAKPGRIGELSMGKFLIQNVAQVMLSFWCPQGRCKAKAELWLLRERVGTELLSSSPSSQRVKH